MKYSVAATSYRSFYSSQMPKPKRQSIQKRRLGNWQGITFTIANGIWNMVIYALCPPDNYLAVRFLTLEYVYTKREVFAKNFSACNV